ncbi:MAG: hypothetical protein SO170_06995 [Butyribacter sp.]|nr:hypothetical protein [bacterium]MDY3854680.1 hypothetical protein [Butyribacter sp.]
MKHLYKFIGLLFLFIASIFFFGRDIPELSVTKTTATSLQDSTFPIVYLQVNDYTINTLHGYSSEMNSDSVRESITPLDTTKKFTVKIQQNESKIKKLKYELRDIANDKVLETNELTAFDTEDGYRTAVIKISQGLDTSTEYGMQITLTTSYSKKIHFYTRIKYYNNDCFLDEKLDFVNSFHQATFNKEKSFDISPYLEANTSDDSTFADVNIHSSRNLITWKKLNPKKLTKAVPTIKEINIETASVFQDYFVQAKTDSGKEIYHVKEFYRVRYSSNRIYLLAFNRTMEAFFNPDLISLTKSEFKIGITNQSDLDISSSDSNKKVAFVRNGTLWYYDLEKNKLTSVFSFAQDSKDYLRDHYDQHDIKILQTDDDGNISFMLYGYMNCGDYEGRVGILLYDYSAEDNQITERVYIPLTTTYQKLKEDLGKFSYVNKKNIFYFSLNDTVYAYNIASKRYDILTEEATRNHFSMLEAAKCFVWSNMNEDGYADNITILDLDTSKELTVKSPANQNIVVFGTIDSNIVYGFVRNKDIYESTTGDVIKPAYQLIISDCKGTVLRKYRIKNYYVTSASVDDNVIHLKRVKKQNGRFKDTTDDTIMNQKNTVKASVHLTTRVTQQALTEKYLSLPAGFVLANKPEVTSTKCVMVTENTTLHLTEEDLSKSVTYYIYANGGITQSTTSASKAITLADEQMGVVMDSDSHIVWERGGKFLSKQLSNISYPEGNTSTIKACTNMLLQAAQVTTTTSQLKGKSILSMLKKHLERPVNLTGCTLDEVLYFVSSERPVIGMLDNNHAVLITEYTSSTVSWMDPATRSKRTVALTTAEHMFKNAGYKFVSYISN